METWRNIPIDLFFGVVKHSLASDLSSLRLVCRNWAHGVVAHMQEVRVNRLNAGIIKKMVSLRSLDLSGCRPSKGVDELEKLRHIKAIKFGKNFCIHPRKLTGFTHLQVFVTMVVVQEAQPNKVGFSSH